MRQQINTSPPLRSSLPYSDRGGAAKYIVTEGHVRPAGAPLGTRGFHVTGRLSYISKDGETYCRLIKLGKTFQVVGSAYKQAKAQESIARCQVQWEQGFSSPAMCWKHPGHFEIILLPGAHPQTLLWLAGGGPRHWRFLSPQAMLMWRQYSEPWAAGRPDE